MQQFLSNIKTILESLLSQYSVKITVEKLSNSVFAMVVRQLVSELNEFLQQLPIFSLVPLFVSVNIRCVVCSLDDLSAGFLHFRHPPWEHPAGCWHIDKIIE